MKHLQTYRIFEASKELTPEERDLLDDLADIGLADRFKVVCTLFVMVPLSDVHPFSWPEWNIKNIVIKNIFGSNRKEILSKAFEKVLSGNFEIESDHDIQDLFKIAPEIKEIVSKDHMVKVAKMVEKISPESPEMHMEGKLHTLQVNFLLEEILDQMEGRAKDLMEEYTESKTNPEYWIIRHLRENIGWSILVTEE